MDTYDLVSKHPLLAILRNVPLEKTVDYAAAVLQDKFPYLDNGTMCDVTYTLLEGKSNHVLPFQSSTTYTLTADDYEQIWQKRGVYYLTPASEALLPEFLSKKYPTVADKKVIVLNYAFSADEPDESEFSDFLPYALSLSQLLVLPDYKEHEITGVVGSVKSPTYGRFYMKDGADSIYVYGVLNENGDRVWKDKNIQVGDMITIRAKYSDDTEEPQLVNGVYVSHTPANSPAPRPQNTG